MEGDVASPADVMPLVRMFEEAEQTTADARKLAERDRDYFDGKQLSSDEKKELKKRGQPPVIYNRIQRKIDYLSGLEKQQRKDPKAFPRTPKDEDAADAATDAIRYVCDDEAWDNKRSAAWDDLLIEGTCAIMVGHKNGKMGPDPALFQIPWDRYFYDPHASKADLADKRYDGVVTWYDFEDAAARWPDKRDILEGTMGSTTASDTYDDKPKFDLWGDAKRRRVRVVELYYLKGGTWLRCVFTRLGHLEDPAPSPYLDEDKQPENPIKAMSLYVDRDNNRYGAVRVMISPQDEINKRRSKGLHLITMRQARVGLSSAEDKEKIRKELAKPDGIISGDKDDFEILPTNDMASGNFEMLQEAKNEIDLLGANAALAGKNENELSGRAILAQQQGGMVEVARMFDRLRSLSIAVYRSIWNRIRQMWTDEKWIRITDDENNLRFVGLNQKVTVKQLAQEVSEGDQEALKKAAQLVGPQVLQAALTQPQEGDQQAMAMQQQAQQVIGMFVQQNGDQVVEVRNAINELDVDIVIDEGMDTPSVQAEQFETLAKMMPAAPPQIQPILWEALFEASSFRNKDKLIEKMNQGPPSEQVQQQQEATEIQKAGAIADIEKTKSETAKNIATAQTAGAPEQPQGTDPIEAARVALEGEQNQIDGFRAETERMQALQPDHKQAA